MDKEHIKTRYEENLQQKFEELKLPNKNTGFRKFMILSEELNSYSLKENEQVLIKLDNSTEAIEI